MNSIKIDLAKKEISKFKRQHRPARSQSTSPAGGSGSTVTIDINDLNAMATAGLIQQNPVNTAFDGNKFYGGFGPTNLYYTDYWELRAKSSQVFKDNLYARGILRRLVTNEITTGLCLEATPDEKTLGLPEDSLTEWSEDIENRFALWAINPQVCDYKKKDSFSKIQQYAKLEAYVAGDILVIINQNKDTKMPHINLINGAKVQGVGDKRVRKGHLVRHGVETDKQGRQVAYWIQKDDGNFDRIPAYGATSGRRTAFLMYGTDKRYDDVRGEPALSIILQSLKEIDRYRDSVQRKAVINSLLALFIKKTEPKMGTKPISGGVTRKETATVTDSDGGTRSYNIGNQIPGVVLDELQHGEEPTGFKSDGIDLSFGKFEQAIVHAMAWALEIPPEILILSFNSNYSASQAAINEFKMTLNVRRLDMGTQFCTPIYTEWFISSVLKNKVMAGDFLRYWRDPLEYERFGAWLLCDWTGAQKPSTDLVKTGKGYKLIVDEGWITNDRAAREITGTKFTKNVKRLKRENQLKVEAMRPLAEFKKEYGEIADETQQALEAGLIEAVTENVMDAIEAETPNTP